MIDLEENFVTNAEFRHMRSAYRTLLQTLRPEIRAEVHTEMNRIESRAENLLSQKRAEKDKSEVVSPQTYVKERLFR